MKPYRDLLLASTLVLAVSCLAGLAVRDTPPQGAAPAVQPVPPAPTSLDGSGTGAEGHVHFLRA